MRDTFARVSAQSGKPASGAPTVADVLALPELVAAGVRVVAGAGALPNEVRWVHAGEIDDIATYLSGGELLFTAGTGIDKSEAGVRGYIERLVAVGASALVVELGRGFKRIPPAMVEQAERLGLPLAVLQRDVPFAGVMRTVHRLIIGRQYELIERAEAIAAEFNTLLLSGGNLAHVVHKLAELVDNPVVLEDAAHQVVEYSGDREVSAIIASWRAHSRADHRPSSGDAAGPQVVDTTPACCWAPVTVKGAPWGRLHLLAARRPIDAVDRLAVERASAAIGLALLTRHHDLHESARNRSELIADLMRRAPDDVGEFLRRARSLGADLEDRSLVVIAFDGAGEGDLVEEMATSVRRPAQQLGMAYIASSQGDRGYVLAGARPGPRAEETIVEFAQRVASATGGQEPTVGVSSTTSVHGLPRAFYEADECLRYARLSGEAGVHQFHRLGLHLLLLSLADRHELAAFIENELGGLLEADGKGRGALLDTLRAILECEGNKVEAARRLSIERRSLYYRLERLEQVLGRSLKSADARLALAVALRALDLTEDRAQAQRSVATARA